ncbi:hypothetical protein RSAG8_00831, partial [Rhizoctonia solani AG-8 WAC10335]
MSTEEHLHFWNKGGSRRVESGIRSPLTVVILIAQPCFLAPLYVELLYAAHLSRRCYL